MCINRISNLGTSSPLNNHPTVNVTEMPKDIPVRVLRRTEERPLRVTRWSNTLQR